MRKIILLLQIAMVLASTYVVAQTDQVKITWSPDMVKEKYIEFADVLGKDNEGFFIVHENQLSVMSAGKNTGVIEKYDSQLNLIFRKELIVKFHDNEVEYFSAKKMGDKFYLFSRFWDNKERVRYFLASEISKNGEIIGEPKELISMDESVAGRGNNIGMAFSFDSTKVLLYSDIKEKGSEAENYFFKTFDVNLNPIWESMITLNYSSKLFAIQKYVVDNEANIHILGRVTVERKDREKGDPSFFYTMLSYFHASKDMKEFIPDVGDAYTSGIGIKPDRNGNIIATGFYSEKSANSLKGVFLMKINIASKAVVVQKVKAFDVEFLSLFLRENQANKGKELYSYVIDYIYLDQNDDIIVMAEQYYVQVYTTTNSSGYTTTRYIYNYNHIISVKFSAAGDVLWWAKIPKLQRSGNSTYFSYMFAVKNNNVYVLYNEHKKNIESLDPKKMATLANPKDAITVLVAIDNKGNVEKIPMFEAKDDEGNTIFKPTTAKYLSPSENLALSIRGKKFKLGRISF